jgi:hypothetical protein
MKNLFKVKAIRNILTVWLGFIFLVTALGVVATYQNSPVLRSYIPSVDRDTILGELGSEEVYTVADGRRISTLVESPDVGLLEIGVAVEGELNLGEIFVVDNLGRVYSPSEINANDKGYAFTINISTSEELKYDLLWSNKGSLLAVLSVK